MTTVSSPLALYRLLPGSNCRQCGLPTCLAFAAAVIKAQRRIGDCPCLDQATLEQLEVIANRADVSGELQMKKHMDELKRQIGGIDFPSAALRLGGSCRGGSLTIRCLGKRYSVDVHGHISSECHINPWVIVPLIDYILHSPGKDPVGEWVPFRELRDGATWNPLFVRRCEAPLKQIADDDPELFEYLLYVFGGVRTVKSLSNDISVVLHPLPKFPVMIRYSNLEEGGVTGLSIFFDLQARENLAIESIFALSTGVVTMLGKITQRHFWGNIVS